MSKSKKNRAKIRARKAAKRTAKRKAQKTKPLMGGGPRIDQVVAWPLLECLISDSWRETESLTQILIARQEGWGRVELVAAVITESIEYAKSLGFEPHLDALPLLGDLSTLDPVEEEIPLGLPNGKPFYVAGPDDDADYVMATLREAVGDGNFEFIVPGSLG